MLVFVAGALGVSAQPGAFQFAPHHFSFKGASNVFKHTMNKAGVREDASENQVWWGYVQDNTYRTGLGAQSTGAYNQAIFISKDNAVLKGNTIKAVRFYLRALSAINNVKLWISTSLPSSAADADILVMDLDKSTLKGGDDGEDYVGKLNEVELTTPYTVGENDIYVGYSYNVTSAASSAGQYPIVLSYETGFPGSLYLSTANIPWQEGHSYGPLDLRVLVEGTFLQNAATPNTFGTAYAALNEPYVTSVPVNNYGQKGISSIDYTVTSADGTVSEEQHIDLESTYSLFGGTTYVQIPFVGDAVVGTQQKTLTITKVNGVDNEASTNSVTFDLTTISKIVPHGIAVEEFTGTTCGWCPRGLVGMEKMRKEFGDAFVGIGIHRYTTSLSSDAMYISTYNQVSFGGAPSSRINRGAEVDPYYGTSNDVLDDIRAELAVPAMVGLTLTGRWNEDSTEVAASADVEALVDGNYAIEYVLIADSLTGKTTPWRQQNYYSQYSPNQLPPDLQFLATIGSTYYPVFNDVAITVAKQAQTTAIGKITAGQVVNNTYTLKMPSESGRKNLINAITKERVYVVALLIDKSNNRIANAAKSVIKPFKDPTPEPVIADGTYYLQNVATGKYLAAGHSWGTRSIVNETGLDFIVTSVEEGKYTFDSQVSNGGDSHYLGDNLFVDAAALAWTAEKVADGIVTLNIEKGFLAVGENDETALVAEADESAQWKVISPEERLAALANATEEAPVNATFLIKYANFNRNDLRKGNAWETWSETADGSTNFNISGGNNENNNAESYHAKFLLSQTIEGLPNGVYEMTAQGFYRQDGSDNDNLPYFFINNKKATFPQMAGTENSMTDASVSFTNGLYTIEPVMVYVNDGKITLGAKNDENLNLWCIWDNFQLKYYGDNVSLFTESISIDRIVGQGYTPDRGEVDFTEAKKFLGVDELTTSMLRIENPDGVLISDYAPFDGWFNTKGFAETWGELNAEAEAADKAGICVKFFQAIAEGKFDICDMNGADEPGKTYTVKWQLVNGEKAVRYTINVNFVEAPVIFVDDYTNKAITVLKLYPSAVGAPYEAVLTDEIDESEVSAAIGDEWGDVYGVGPKVDGKETMTANYSCDPHPGFWCLEDGTADVWVNSTFGVSLIFNEDGSKFHFSAWTKEALTKDVATSFYLVNKDTKEYVTYLIVLYPLPADVMEGIENVNTLPTENGDIYNLSGQKVEKPTSGLYISNGKKLLVK